MKFRPPIRVFFCVLAVFASFATISSGQGTPATGALPPEDLPCHPNCGSATPTNSPRKAAPSVYIPPSPQQIDRSVSDSFSSLRNYYQQKLEDATSNLNGQGSPAPDDLSSSDSTTTVTTYDPSADPERARESATENAEANDREAMRQQAFAAQTQRAQLSAGMATAAAAEIKSFEEVESLDQPAGDVSQAFFGLAIEDVKKAADLLDLPSPAAKPDIYSLADSVIDALGDPFAQPDRLRDAIGSVVEDTLTDSTGEPLAGGAFNDIVTNALKNVIVQGWSQLTASAFAPASPEEQADTDLNNAADPRNLGKGLNHYGSAVIQAWGHQWDVVMGLLGLRVDAAEGN